jgi:hypothetical protein
MSSSREACRRLVADRTRRGAGGHRLRRRRADLGVVERRRDLPSPDVVALSNEERVHAARYLRGHVDLLRVGFALKRFPIARVGRETRQECSK